MDRDSSYELSPNVTVTVRYTLTARPFSVAGLYRHCRTARLRRRIEQRVRGPQDADVVDRAVRR